MSFDFKKEEQKVFNFKKSKGIGDVKGEVVLEIDVSGSIEPLFKQGTIQKAVQRIAPLAMNFDDNRNLDVYTFANGERTVSEIESVTEFNYDGYVQKYILGDRNVPKWGGTDYEPVLRRMLEDKGFIKQAKSSGFLGFGGGSSTSSYSQNSSSGYPVINFFITDGENTDKSATTSLLQTMEQQRMNAYVLFIGVGHERFGYLNEVADKFENTGFVKIDDLDKSAGSDLIYQLLLPDELVGWLRNKS